MLRIAKWLGVAMLAAACGSDGGAPAGRPGLVDHSPHHGGVVFAGPRVTLEATATRDGVIRVYVEDEWRRPLPLDAATGTVTLALPSGEQSLPLAPRGAALEAQGPALAGDNVAVMLQVDRSGEVVRLPATVPLVDGAPGAAGIPGACEPPPPDDRPGRQPRCVLTFLQALAVIATARDGDVAVLSVLESPTTAWRMPAATLLSGFQATPPEDIGTGHAPHVEEPTAIALRADGREATLAMGEHLLRYEVASGRFVRMLTTPGPPLRGVAWSPDGSYLALTLLTGPTVHLLNAADGAPIRTFDVASEATAIAFSNDGRRLAVGTEAGPVVVVDIDGSGTPRQVAEPTQRTEGVAFAGERLVAAGADGVLRVWEGNGALAASVDVGAPIARLAVTADGTRAATADREGHIRLHALPAGAVVETIAWHRGLVRALAWAGPVLLSGDADRQLAVWELPNA